MNRFRTIVDICALIVIVALCYIVISGSPTETPRDQEKANHIVAINMLHEAMHEAKMSHIDIMPMPRKGSAALR